MTTKQAVFVVSRALAVILTISGLVEITFLPERIFALSHHLDARSALATSDYWSSYYLLMTSFLVLRIVGYLCAAAIFVKCEPWVEALFLPQSEEPVE